MPSIFELSLYHHSGTTYAEARLTRNPGSAAVTLASAMPVPIDPQALLALVGEPLGYGQRLSEQLFAEPAFYDAWLQAASCAAGETLHVRLRIDSNAQHLHALHWETLCYPRTREHIALRERVLFARLIDSATLVPVVLRPRPELSALVAVANPSDLSYYRLSEIDVKVEAVCEALGATRTSTLGDAPDAAGRATRIGLAAELRSGPQIVILVAHGRMSDAGPIILLERNDGRTDCVSGADLVSIISRLSEPPLLLVLASCHSAGSGSEDAFQALGPQLAAAGVPAVLGFQGNVSVPTIEAFLPTLIRELLRDGQIDRAVAAARADLSHSHPWWQAVLWLRTDGRLWAEAPASSSEVSPRTVPRWRTSALLLSVALLTLALLGASLMMWRSGGAAPSHSTPPINSDAEIVILVADFGDGGDLSALVAEELDDELRNRLNIVRLAIRPTQAVRNEDEAKTVAQTLVPNDGRGRVVIVLWGKIEDGQLRSFQLSNFDHVEGNEVTYHLELEPYDDTVGSGQRKELRDRMGVVTLFISALDKLLSHEYDLAETLFYQAIALVDATQVGGHEGAGITDTLHFYRGRALHAQGRTAEAAVEFQLVTDKLNPDYAMAYIGLGNIALGNGELDTAQERFEQALNAVKRGIFSEAGTTYARGKAFLGLANVALGRAEREPGQARVYGEEAEEWADQALQAFLDEPDVPARYIALGYYFVARGRDEQGQEGDAVVALERCIDRVESLSTDAPSADVYALCFNYRAALTASPIP